MTINPVAASFSRSSARFLMLHAILWNYSPWSATIRNQIDRTDWKRIPDILSLGVIVLYSLYLSGSVTIMFLVLFSGILKLEDILNLHGGAIKYAEYTCFVGWIFEGWIYVWTGLIFFSWNAKPDAYQLTARSRIWVLWVIGAPATLSISAFMTIWVLGSKI